ncbi:membrane-associated protein, putative, partial [Bodo saltans]
MPMVAMEFTWEVALLFGVAAPALAYIPKLRSFLQSRRFFGAHGYVLFYITAILSLFCFDVTHNPGRRIWTTSIGGISILLATFTRYLHTPSLELLEGERARINYALPLGFAVSMIIRVMFVSADPLYTNAIYNAFLGIVFGLWCAWIQFRRSAYAPAPVSTPSVEDGKTPAGTNAPAFSPVVLGIAFGNCLSLSLIMVSSSGFIPRLLGLDPWPSGGLVILAFLLGLYLSSTVVPTFRNSRGGNILSTIAQAPVLVALFVVGFLVMYLGTRQSNRSFEKPHAHYPINWETPREHVKLSDWTTEEDFRGSPELALLGGCAIVFALGTVWPQLMDLLFTFLRCKQPKANVRWFKSMELTYGVIVAIHLLMQVYVVCHPFVPLGWILRDRLDFTLIVAILGTLVPTLVAARAASQALTATDTSEASVLKFRTPPVKTLVMVLGLFLCCIFGRIIGTPDSHSVAPQLTTLHDKLSDVLSVSKELQDFELQLNKFDEPRLSEAFRKFSIASIEEKRDAFKRNVEHKMGSDVLHAAEQTTPFSAMIWTVHFAIDNFNVDGLSRMVDLIKETKAGVIGLPIPHGRPIKETKAGVIGLLESDSVRVHTGNRDLVEYIAYHLGYDYTDYGPTAFDGTFGCALITKYPILYSRRYVLPSPLGELACLIHAKLDLFGVETNVYVGHWGNTQHWADGVLQSEFLGELVQRNPGPSVFLGYLVTKPQLGNYNYYASASEPGKFRDTALQLYKQRPWRRLTNLGGYVEQVSAEDQQLAEVDQQYHRPPEGADARYFYFEDTQRYSTAHPRWEFVDRYCQYILYKTGLPQDEKPEHAGQLQPYHFELVDWWRVLDIHELSDTEIQVVQLALRAGH